MVDIQYGSAALWFECEAGALPAGNPRVGYFKILNYKKRGVISGGIFFWVYPVNFGMFFDICDGNIRVCAGDLYS